MGHDLSIHRWRGNLWLSGAPAWDELVVTNARDALEATVRDLHPRVHRRAESGSGFVDLARLRAAGATRLAATPAELLDFSVG